MSDLDQDIAKLSSVFDLETESDRQEKEADARARKAATQDGLKQLREERLALEAERPAVEKQLEKFKKLPWDKIALHTPSGAEQVRNSFRTVENLLDATNIDTAEKRLQKLAQDLTPRRENFTPKLGE